MMMPRHFLPLTVGMAIFVLLALPTGAAFAQESAPRQANSPAGVGVMIFMMGLAAIAIVGLYYAGQNRAAGRDKSESDTSNQAK